MAKSECDHALASLNSDVPGSQAQDMEQPASQRGHRESSAESSLFDSTPPGKEGTSVSIKGKAKAKGKGKEKPEIASSSKRKREDEGGSAIGTARSKANKKAKATTSRSGSASLEDELKRLKGYVVACGVRKQWKKVSQDEGIGGSNDRSLKAQCAAVRRMLADLGMSGRLSIERAKKIRADREFAEELAAVQEGAAALSPRKSRGRGSAGSKQTKGGRQGRPSPVESGGEESSAPDAPQAQKTKRKAQSSFAAFADALNSSGDE